MFLVDMLIQATMMNQSISLNDKLLTEQIQKFIFPITASYLCK